MSTLLRAVKRSTLVVAILAGLAISTAVVAPAHHVFAGHPACYTRVC